MLKLFKSSSFSRWEAGLEWLSIALAENAAMLAQWKMHPHRRRRRSLQRWKEDSWSGLDAPGIGRLAQKRACQGAYVRLHKHFPQKNCKASKDLKAFLTQIAMRAFIK
jgi:hypothetical protein